MICWPKIKEQQRDALMKSRLLAVQRMWQKEGEVRNLIAHQLRDLTPLLGRLGTESRDFH